MPNSPQASKVSRCLNAPLRLACPPPALRGDPATTLDVRDDAYFLIEEHFSPRIPFSTQRRRRKGRSLKRRYGITSRMKPINSALRRKAGCRFGTGAFALKNLRDAASRFFSCRGATWRLLNALILQTRPDQLGFHFGNPLSEAALNLRDGFALAQMAGFIKVPKITTDFQQEFLRKSMAHTHSIFTWHRASSTLPEGDIA